MQRDTLLRLEAVNQLALTEEERADALAFFGARAAELDELNEIDTSEVERMVHVLPILTVVREDVAAQPYTREELQAGAPDADEGYWRVPRVVE